MNAKGALLLFIVGTMNMALYGQSSLPKRKLADTLYALSGIDMAKMGPEKWGLYERQIKQIETSGVLVNALQQKGKVPDFTLKNSKGKPVSLATELQKGPVLLLWYQGGWNKYDALALRYFQAYAAEFKKYGAAILALSPELPEKALLTQTKNKITFDVLTDTNNALAKQLGITYTLNDTLKKEYETLYKLSQINGNTGGVLPLPAAYLVHPNGKVTFAFVQADYRHHVEPSDILRVLKGMGFPARQ